MSLLGAGNLGKNGKQQSTPTISRTGAFGTNTSNSTPAPVAPNPQPGVQPKPTNQNSILTDIGESVSHSLVNTARDVKKDPMGAVSSRLTNAVVDTVDVAVNTGANLINSQAQKPVVPNVVGPKIIGNMQGADTNFNTNIQPGSLNRNPQIGTRGSGGLIVPGNGMESVNRTIGAVSLIPGLGKGVGIAGEAAMRGASSAARRAIAEPIIVNAAESDIASAAGRSIVKQTARRVKPTRVKPRSSIPPVGPMSRQLAQYAPKLELADTQPLRLANEYSAAFTDDTAANSQEIINSLYREADALAKQEKRGALVAPESYDMNSTARLTTELGIEDDLTRVSEGRWAKVYDQMVKDKTIDTDKFADADSFVNYIKASSHTTGGNKSRITPSPEIVEANKTYLRMFHGSDEKPLNYYRTGPSGKEIEDPVTGEMIDDAAFGDYSLDKVMGGSYRPDGKYVTARVTPEQLKFPVMPIDKPTTYVDEFAQNFGKEIPSSQVKIQGRQWDDVPDFTGTAPGGYESGVRGFPMGRFYELQDVDSLIKINDVSQAARDAAGLTDADIARFKEILKDRSLVAETTENADGTFSLKWTPDAIKWLNNEDIQILHKQAIARNSPFIKNKFDLDKSSGTVTGDPEGLYGVVTKRPIEGTVIRQGVPDEPIAAESDIVSAAGRPIVRQSARPPRVTPRSSSSPIGPQLAQFAPKRELANVQPIRMVTEHSRAFGDSPESNAREVIDSVYRRAQQIAESEGRQIFSTNREPQVYMKQPWNQTDLQRAAIANWSDVYDQMIKKGTLSKEEYPTSESFLDFIRSSGHIDGGSNSGPVDPTLKAANDAYLDLFHGEGASTKPISFYRNSSSGTGDPIFDASGDYSLDRTMAYNYGPKGSNGLQKTRDRIRMDVTTDSLRHPIVPLYRRDYNGEVRLDEWAQNWNNKEFREGTDWNEGGIVEGIQPKIIGPQLEGVFPFSDAQRYREFSPATRYGVRDYEFAGELEDIPDEMFEKYGITKDDQKIWERILNRHFKPVTDEQGNTTGMALVDKRASEYGVKAGEKNPVVNPLNSKEHEVLRKVSKAMHEAGMIKEPFHYNKFDVPQLRGRGKRGVVTGDPEGLYSTVTKQPRGGTVIRQGKTNEQIAAEEQAIADRQALLESTAPSQELLDSEYNQFIESEPYPDEVVQGRYDDNPQTVSRRGVFHGSASATPGPLESREYTSHNLFGGDVFSTDNPTNALDYTSGGTEGLGGPMDWSKVLKVSGEDGKKILSLHSRGKTIAEQDPELFLAIEQRLKDEGLDANTFRGMEGGSGNTRKYHSKDSGAVLLDRASFFSAGQKDPRYNQILKEEALKRGWHGFTHDGGYVTGGSGHQVIGYWDPTGMSLESVPEEALKKHTTLNNLRGKVFQRELEYQQRYGQLTGKQEEVFDDFD